MNRQKKLHAYQQPTWNPNWSTTCLGWRLHSCIILKNHPYWQPARSIHVETVIFFCLFHKERSWLVHTVSSFTLKIFAVIWKNIFTEIFAGRTFPCSPCSKHLKVSNNLYKVYFWVILSFKLMSPHTLTFEIHTELRFQQQLKLHTG